MFGFLFNKDPEKDFQFHKDRTKKMLTKTQERFSRADDYLCGIGIGRIEEIGSGLEI